MYAYRGQRCDTSVGPKDGKDCWPPRRKEVQDKESAIGGWGFYSPGLGNTCFAVPTKTTVTTATCGPSGISEEGSYVFPATVPVQITGNVSSTIVTLWAPMFQLNFESTDLKPATTLPSSTSTPSETSTESSTTSSLSEGAIAGIAVGTVLAGIILGIAATLLVLRYRRNKTLSNKSQLAYGDATAYQLAAQPGAEVHQYQGGGITEFHEVQAKNKPVELSAQM
ncbi:hypothetical protein MHUMG1_01412 [Metarhizium humberi]|uniref:CRA-b-like protein n=1 Tax=Metarhizium humberi TaxID=2596975 RepID=A0A9P8MF16_9HYPO|nr:hypothetical protein MHUMG1_01412 [Metarhizium humberi]